MDEFDTLDSEIVYAVIKMSTLDKHMLIHRFTLILHIARRVRVLELINRPVVYQYQSV